MAESTGTRGSTADRRRAIQGVLGKPERIDAATDRQATRRRSRDRGTPL